MVHFFRKISTVSPAFLSLYGVCVLTVVCIFQYGFGFMPCTLCLYERGPWALIILLGTLACLLANYRRVFLYLSVATLSFSATLAIFHAGLEYGFWHGTQACSTVLTLAQNGKELMESLHTDIIPRCNVASWTLFGISMAGYNALLSIDACIFACFLAGRESQR